MKKGLLMMVVLLFAWVGLAGAVAVPATWTDSLSWENLKLNANNPTVSYQHDIRDDGFDPLLDGNSTFDVATDYTLTVGMHDDKDNYRHRYEAVKIDQPGLLGDTFMNTFSWHDEVSSWSVLGLVQINALGVLSVSIERKAGDFYLDYSDLVVNGCENAPVPEPATLLLLGSGLAGLAFYRRKRK